MNFTLNDNAIEYTLSGNLNFTINDQVITFNINSTGSLQNVRLLEDGFYRSLEDDSYRLLE